MVAAMEVKLYTDEAISAATVSGEIQIIATATTEGA